MTDLEDRPSVAELYGVAATSGCMPNIVLAAGLQRCHFGSLLLRLKAEYDGVRSSLERAGQIRRRGIEAGRELRTKAARLLIRAEAAEFGREQFEREAAALLAEAEVVEKHRTPHEIVSARAFILLELTSLNDAKREIGILAVRMSIKRRVRADVAMRLAGRVLDVFLDDICHHCDGTGLMGSGYRGERAGQCDKCKGTAHRRDILGNHLSETMLAADILAELQRQTSEAARRIGQALANDNAPLSSEINGELRTRLGELRSPEAERD